jgi:hypothetical protein
MKPAFPRQPTPTVLLLFGLAFAALPFHAGPAHAGAAADSILYATRTANNNLMGVTLTNYGFLGNNFINRSASLEYPRGSQYEHMARGGLWVGAQAQDALGSFTGVTTACVDGSVGTAPADQTEFTPAGLEVTARSTLPNSPYYDPAAVSELDTDCWFSDLPARSGSGESHRPLKLLVHQRSFAWSFGDLAHVLFLRYVVHVLGSTPLVNAWIGLDTELASGTRSDYSCWPPATACGATGRWYGKKWIQYEDSLRLIREHYCFNQPVPAGCNLSHVPAWVGVRLLGVAPGSLTDPEKHVTLAAWNWSPGNPARDQDIERYTLMSAGTVQDLTGPDFQPLSGDPVELLAVGPFATIAPGDSVTVDFALVGGTEVADIQEHSRTAQLLHDGNFDITVPVEVSLVSAEAEPGVARLRWSVASGADTRWTVARRREDTPWQGVAGATADGRGDVRFEDRGVAAGGRYGYRLESPAGATFGEAWVEVPRETGFALLGARPNPAGPHGLEVFFSLAEAGPVSVEVFDPAGRRVLARDLGTLEPGSHQVSLDRPAALRPGACFIRLRQGGRSRTQRAVVLE